ncbi:MULTISPECIES: bifunctional aspartate kinase/homoserine dehydrogenase I [unclassified Robiginitalea]|uniref:bifunctional aspartate kinase/homoserine dehydrogenase I n=1 Tax=Robiginitalea TaxID=252306 RepID=UPI002349F104|nr:MULTISPECIES: bifunctional aspartate kinase/homoserine dehydrogenase I [unclassified Robiginitalea]MDC6353739.1 bifunctional aspartate kinase/homoserine dehydrogenase I [Robiginitalea sp. PM2]MDC6375813.1 bifunctional aspartate kinase/homoserine dehydrogenase I [Robiginitalea sp. SP8]
MKVLKFGGTSVANAQAISETCKIVTDAGRPLAVVVSALGGVTDLLLLTAAQAAAQQTDYQESLASLEKRHLDTIRELIPPARQAAVIGRVKTDLNTLETLLEGAFLIGETTPKLLDKIVSYGELLSSFLIAAYYESQGLPAVFRDSRELIETDATFGNAHVRMDATRTKVREALHNPEEISILPGFVGATASGDTTTLGRGGSDYSAAILAAALGAEELQIWTDVSGMFTANPRLVRQARPIPLISYEEAMELSHFGAKVLYPPTIQPVLDAGIPIRIKNTFDPHTDGTLIHARGNTEGRTVRGISHVPGIALVSLEGPGMIGIPGISKRFFETLSDAGISIIFITQASSEHSICVGIAALHLERAIQAVNDTFAYEMDRQLIKPVQAEDDLAIIALVGDQMKQHQGLSGKMFSALGRNNVNIRAIAQGASERNISAVIRSGDVKKALNTLHEAFFEEQVKQLNLFVMGVGNVGSRLLAQIGLQQHVLKKELRLNLRVVGISNSRKMAFDASGLPVSEWQDVLEKGEPANLDAFFSRVRELNLRNAIFIDNTASETVSGWYASYLKNSISVVTCNKIACSSEYEVYARLKSLARTYNAPFLFETNVGAGLPVIDTLKNLILSGDRVRRIRAVLSGSLNFVFNNYNGKDSFADVVRLAGKEGYTEPDPRIDLSGVDVMRKILILARESGLRLEMDAIENRSFLPEGALEAESVDAFYEVLEQQEPHFRRLWEQADGANCRLKYVAQLDGEKASVGLEEIPEGHDFFNLSGSDNIVLFYTDRYSEQPLIVKGAGAGAEVTASGIFADIIRIGNF